jgi:PAP2 superfamily protein
MKRLCQCGLVVFVVILASASARADVVTEWNEAAFRAALVANSSALNMTRFIAIVEAAVFDAVNGIDRRYTPIHVDPAGPSTASRRAAAAQAAYAILVKLYGQGGVFLPNQQQALDAKLTASLAEIAARESMASIESGRTWGQTVANAIWAFRLTDGFGNVVAFPGNTALGQWRQTPNDPYPGTSAAGIGYKQFSEMKPWVIASPSQFRPAGPPALTSAQYTKDFDEVKLMGRKDSGARTSDQTVYSWFWANGTASYFWNRTALSILEDRRDDGDDRRGHDDGEDGDDRGRGRQNNSLLENARILATLNVAMADAAIGCWDAKYVYSFWRPITAIRETDDGNAATTPDSTWMPLFATPGHPDYPSGHSCVSGAATTVLANEFGERLRFDVTSDVLLGVTRSFRSFTSALEEVKNARIFAGIHFRTACDDGTTLGKAVAHYVLDHAFQRVH